MYLLADQRKPSRSEVVFKSTISLSSWLITSALPFHQAPSILIIPGFATDAMGLLIIFPLTRKVLFKKFKNKQPPKKYVKDDLIEGDAEDIDEKK